MFISLYSKLLHRYLSIVPLFLNLNISYVFFLVKLSSMNNTVIVSVIDRLEFIDTINLESEVEGQRLRIQKLNLFNLNVHIKVE